MLMARIKGANCGFPSKEGDSYLIGGKVCRAIFDGVMVCRIQLSAGFPLRVRR